MPLIPGSQPRPYVPGGVTSGPPPGGSPLPHIPNEPAYIPLPGGGALMMPNRPLTPQESAVLGGVRAGNPLGGPAAQQVLNALIAEGVVIPGTDPGSEAIYSFSAPAPPPPSATGGSPALGGTASPYNPGGPAGGHATGGAAGRRARMAQRQTMTAAGYARQAGESDDDWIARYQQATAPVPPPGGGVEPPINPSPSPPYVPPPSWEGPPPVGPSPGTSINDEIKANPGGPRPPGPGQQLPGGSPPFYPQGGQKPDSGGSPPFYPGPQGGSPPFYPGQAQKFSADPSQRRKIPQMQAPPFYPQGGQPGASMNPKDAYAKSLATFIR